MENRSSRPELPWPEWEIDGLLGRGGFGDVYRIRREEYGNTYYAALKVVRIPTDEGEVQELEADGISVGSYYGAMISDLIKEISLMESLKAAANVVTIEDHKIIEQKDSVGWILFIRMELLTNLNVYRKNHAMSVEEVLKLGCDICSALEACQKKGIVHRDIKPSNILVSEFGDFKLGDFGISRNLTHTMSGLSRKGTELYMAPEVYRGEKYNATVDIYSLGLVLYNLLNHGRLPFFPRVPAQVTKNDSLNAFNRRIRGEVFPNPDEGGKETGDVLRRACHIDPKMRYQSAVEFKAAIMNCQSREAVDMKPHRGVHKARRTIQKTVVSEETVMFSSEMKNNTPVIKTEGKEKSEKVKTKSIRKYVSWAIGVLAAVCVAGIGGLQSKKPNNEEPQKIVRAEETETATSTADEVMSREWEQVYNTLDEMTSQGVFRFIGRTPEELEKNLYTTGSSDENIQVHLNNEGTKIKYMRLSNLYKNDEIEIGEPLKETIKCSQDEVFTLLGITSEMMEWFKKDQEEEISYKGYRMEFNWGSCKIRQSIPHSENIYLVPYIFITNGEKSIYLGFRNQYKGLDRIQVIDYRI